MTKASASIIVFDGVCNLCSGSVQFIIRRDRDAIFRFAPVQSATGRELLAKHGIDADDVTTFLLVENDRARVRSEAALRIAARLPWPWRALTAFHIVPRTLRDVIYDFIARRRYRWFGRRETCMVPTPALRERFLD